jgi:hypothetical protein
VGFNQQTNWDVWVGTKWYWYIAPIYIKGNNFEMEHDDKPWDFGLLLYPIFREKRNETTTLGVFKSVSPTFSWRYVG